MGRSKLLLGHSLEWRVNTVALLKEIIEGYPGNGVGIFFSPINIFKGLLAEVATRAIEINDPVMNALMCRLALYEESDPYSKEYNHDAIQKALNHPAYIAYKIKHNK